ncbi:MAG: hypothetical protein IJZ15_04335 [Oscillospiraceae bacterium]|nr:hypothetical protein [Oscillospiraceae bacterium]
MADGKITFDTSVDNSGLQSGLNQSKSIASGFKGVIGKLGKAAIAAVSIGAIVNFGKQAIELGSNVAEVQNVVDTAFGNMSYKIEEFADSAVKNFGMSELSAKKTASTYMAMAKSMGLEEGAASDMAISLTGLTGDVASFYNISQELADTKLKSVFTGETETLKELGVVMTQTNLNAFAMANGYGKTIDKMTQAEAVQLRYAYVTDQLRLASGDFVKTQDSWANQTRILSEQWKELMSIIGQGLIQILAPLVKILNQIVGYLINVANAASAAMSALFGKEQKNYKQTSSATASMAGDIATATESQEALSDATEETAKAAKNASLGMDELNVISQESGDSSSALATLGDSTSDNNVVSATSQGDIDGISEKVKAFLKEIDFEPIKKSFNGFVEELKEFFNLGWDGIEFIYKNILVPLGEFAIEDVLPRFFETLGNAVSLVGVVLNEYGAILKQFYDEFLIPISKYTAPKLLDLWDSLNEKLKQFTALVSGSSAWSDFKLVLGEIYNALKPMVEPLVDLIFAVCNFTMNNAWIDLETAFKNIEDGIGLIADIIRGDFDGAWAHLEDLLINNSVDNAKEKFDNFKESIGNITKKFQEVADQWGEKISNWWKDDVEPWFTVEKWNTVIQGMVDGFAQKWNEVYDFFNVEIPKWWNDNIAPWFTKEKWEQLMEDAIEGIKNGWTDFLNFFTVTIPNWWEEDVAPWFTKEKWEELADSAIKGLVNTIIDGLNDLIRGLNKFSIKVPEIKGITKGFDFGFDIPEIPKLAQGAVIPPNREFLAVLGDQKTGTNIETPLDTMIQAFKTALADGGYAGGDTVVNLTATLDGDVIYRNQERIRQQRGTKTILTGTFAR